MAKKENNKSNALNLGAKASKREGFIDLDKKDIPYRKITVTCACGAEYAAGSIYETLHLDICAQCHPFFTGEAKFVDSEGRIEKFRKKYNLKSS
jgi:large subunit ribosomal protein L31